MGSTEKFCLRWNDFESNISLAFRELREEKDFFDVTLACDDSQVQAHKVILSACSPFFRNVLRRNPHQHPLLYLKGVKYKDILSVLNFMYMGEVNVAQDELNSFLAVAEDLRVKGLTQNGSGAGETNTSKPVSKIDAPKHIVKPREPPEREPISSAPKRPRSVVSTPQSFQTADDDIQEVVPVKSEPREPAPMTVAPVEQTEFYQHPQQVHVEEQQPQGTVALDESYADENYDYGQYEGYDDGSGVMGNSSMALDPADGNKDWDSEIENLLAREPVKNWFVCQKPLCGYQSVNRLNVVSHIQAKHLVNFPGFRCVLCDKLCPTLNAYARHMQRLHK